VLIYARARHSYWRGVCPSVKCVKGATTVLKLGGPSFGAEGGGVWGGGVPRCIIHDPSPIKLKLTHMGRGLGRIVPPPHKFFNFFIWKWWVLVHSGWRFRAVATAHTEEEGRERTLVIGEGRHSALMGERPIFTKYCIFISAENKFLFNVSSTIQSCYTVLLTSRSKT